MIDESMNIFQSIKIELPLIKCLSGHTCRYVCINPRCKKTAFQCIQQECQSCQKQHNKCRLYSLKDIFQQLKLKKQDYTDKQRAAIEKMHKNFEELKAKIQLQKKHIQQKIAYFGLSEYEIKLIKKIYSDKNYQLTGNDFFQLIPTIYEVRKITSCLKQVEGYWMNHKIYIFKRLNEMVDILNRSRCEFNSKITRRIDLIQNFLPKNYSGIKMLYRASQHNFSTDDFHQICDNMVDSLIIAQTIHGKVIGGFPANNFWNKAYSSLEDNESNRFLFSITCNQKYPLIKKNQKVINKYSSLRQGPRFGDQLDFAICNKANVYCSSFKIGKSYMIDNPCIEETYLKFCGSQTGECLLKQWEVFQIYFSNQ